MNENNKIKHLEMIQAVITRMSGNLFLLKGWTVTLVVALFAAIAKDPKGVYVIFSFFVLFIFWLLDGYFLSIERCYRELFDEVRSKSDKDIDFSMNYKKYMVGKNTRIRSMFSSTLLTFYGLLFAIMAIVVITSNINNIKLDFKINWTSQYNTTSSSSQ